GAGRGIGFEIAKAFAAQGARLVLNDLGCDRNGVGADPTIVEAAAEQLRKSGATVHCHAGDVSEEAAAAELIDGAIRDLGTVDVLVNNAGIISDKNLFDMGV